MARTAQIYEEVIAANATETLLVEGGFYKVLAASGDIKISREGGSSIGPILPGQGERINFRRLTIQNLTSEANTVRILVADETFEDTRVYGNVEVIDGGRALVMRDQSFAGWAVMPASVGNFSHVQLYNPLANTKNLAVSRIYIATYASAAYYQLRSLAGPISTLASAAVSKKLNGAAGLAQLRTEANVATIGAQLSPLINVPATSTFTVDYKEPLVIPPGSGVILVAATVNTNCLGSFDFYEFEQ